MDHGSGLRVHSRPCSVPGGLTSEFCLFAEQQFSLSAKGSSGGSEYTKEEQVRKSSFASAKTKDKVEEAAEQRLDCPADLSWLWGVFSELNAARNYTEAGPMSIGHHDLICWQYINQTRLTIWETDLLLETDLRYRVFSAKQREKELKRTRSK